PLALRARAASALSPRARAAATLARDSPPPGESLRGGPARAGPARATARGRALPARPGRHMAGLFRRRAPGPGERPRRACHDPALRVRGLLLPRSRVDARPDPARAQPQQPAARVDDPAPQELA